MSKGFWFVVGAIAGVVAYKIKNTYDEFKEVVANADGNIEKAVDEYFRDAREGAAAGRAATAKKCEEAQPQTAAQESEPATPVHEPEHTPEPESEPAAATAEPEQPVAAPEPVLEPDDKPDSELSTGSKPQPEQQSGDKTDSK